MPLKMSWCTVYTYDMYVYCGLCACVRGACARACVCVRACCVCVRAHIKQQLWKVLYLLNTVKKK